MIGKIKKTNIKRIIIETEINKRGRRTASQVARRVGIEREEERREKRGERIGEVRAPASSRL